MEGHALYQAIGGMDGCRRLSENFYARVQRDPAIGPMFPSLHCAIEALAKYLAQVLGGPPDYSAGRWQMSLREAHLRFDIGAEERGAWMLHMREALQEVGIGEPERGELLGFFERVSAQLVNRGDRPAVGGAISGEMHGRWVEYQAMEEVVSAVRMGNRDRAVALAESDVLQGCFVRDRAALVSLLAMMGNSGYTAMEDYSRRRLLAEPGLAHEKYRSGRTWLHGASAAGSAAMVELLLKVGADPKAKDKAGHDPLYCVANERSRAGGGEVVRALVRAGADTNALGGVKDVSALHMAARRGNVEVAEALLDCGADLEARDSKGETPLRRAVNCGKTEVAALLLARGADRHSRGSAGRTPVTAARTAAMRAVFECGG